MPFDEDSVVRLSAGVTVRAVDDENAYIESPDGVRRLAGTGLRLLSERVLPRLAGAVRGGDLAAAMEPTLSTSGTLELLRVLHEQGIIESADATDATDVADPSKEQEADERGAAPAVEVAVLGTGEVADAVADVLARTTSIHVRRLDGDGGAAPDVDLVVAVTTSVFEPWCARVNEYCVAEGRACLFVGVLPGPAAFVGPLWRPGRATACFECLRTRIFANSVHGATWRAYTRFLAQAGLRAQQRDVRPWTSARLAAAVAARIAHGMATAGARGGAWDDEQAEREREGPPEVLWLEEGGGGGVEDLARRVVLPVPNCRVCGELQQRTSPAAAAALDLTAAVDERVGVVHAVNVRRADSGPQIYLAGSTTSDYSLIRPNMTVIRNGGAGFAKRDALNATIGESLERYAAGLIPSRELRLASWSELVGQGEAAVHPGAFGLFSAAQYAEPDFPFAPFTEETRVRWVQLTRLPDGSRWWLPASQVYLYYRRVEGEASLAPSISTGLAAAESLERAILGGLCEVLERDALAVSWLHRLPPRPVPAELALASTQVAHHLSAATSWRVRFYDLSLEFGPSVVVAVMEQPGGPEPVLSFGSACRTAPVRAVEKAFLEAAQGLTYVRRLLKQHPDFRADPDFGNVDDFTKHAILYSRHPELRREVGYLLHPDEPPLCERPVRGVGAADDGQAAEGAGADGQLDQRDEVDRADQVDRVVRELAAAGFCTYVADLTTPDTRRVGVSVCRVVVPGLQHLSGTHRYRLLGNPRLRTVAKALGYDSRPEDNPYPHPLP
jgi:thiazole/oxazole-forming peptide maturase SagD family component